MGEPQIVVTAMVALLYVALVVTVVAKRLAVPFVVADIPYRQQLVDTGSASSS